MEIDTPTQKPVSKVFTELGSHAYYQVRDFEAEAAAGIVAYLSGFQCDYDARKLKDALRKARRAKHLSQEQLGAAVGFTQQAVSSWERLGGTLPDALTLHALVAVLGNEFLIESGLVPESESTIILMVPPTSPRYRAIERGLIQGGRSKHDTQALLAYMREMSPVRGQVPMTLCLSPMEYYLIGLVRDSINPMFSIDETLRMLVLLETYDDMLRSETELPKKEAVAILSVFCCMCPFCLNRCQNRPPEIEDIDDGSWFDKCHMAAVPKFQGVLDVLRYVTRHKSSSWSSVVGRAQPTLLPDAIKAVALLGASEVLRMLPPSASMHKALMQSW